jgi:NAD(P)-dependent dehydrogenase (short-subunit alcohol dehydrogenase family)
VAPGAVDTAFLQGGTGRAPRNGPQLDVTTYAASLPMRRIATPEDVIGPILFLCGPGAAYMTGQVLWVNGGALTP